MSASLVDALWYLGRGTGVVALVLLSGTVVLGILTRSGRPVAGLPRFGVAALHRSTSLMAVLLLGVHVVSLLFDPYALLSPVDLVVPFQADFRPVWVGLGTLALDLLLVVVATSLLRNRIGARVWRGVHLATYAVWPIAVAHGLGTGTDAGRPWMLVLVSGCVVAVGTALAWRLTGRFVEHARPVWVPAGERPALSTASTLEGIRP